LIGAGGATGLHITALAQEIGCRTVLVPKLASGLCAFGQILSDIKYNYMAATPIRLDGRYDLNKLEEKFKQLENEAVTVLLAEGITRDRIAFKRSIDMRYVGQVHECTVDIGDMPVSAANLPAITQRFNDYHKQLFTYSEPDSLVEIVNIESTVYGKTALLPPPQLARGGKGDSAIKTRRQMIFNADGSRTLTPVYDGELLGADDQVQGPAVIEEPTTTIVVNPGWTARLDDSGTYVITCD
jgi:N-methylhydantoinase A